MGSEIYSTVLKSAKFIRPNLRGLNFVRPDLRGLKICKLVFRGIKLSLRGAKYNLKKLRGTKIFINPVRGTKRSGRNPKLTPTWYPVLKMINPLVSKYAFHRESWNR